ncbi:MAG: ATP phosphoribosyltransferase regulatory subunit [Candidatus Limnocylindria bacterium]
MIDRPQSGLPRGFRDMLPTEARELHALERTLMSTFESHGYAPLELPTVELAADAVAVDERRIVRFLDRDGRLLALRPDVTAAVARVAAQRYRDATEPLRLCYFTAVFREEASMRGSEREYDQAGVEIIGASGRRADAEVIALLAAALEVCGLGEAQIDLGHAGWLHGYLDELDPGVAEATARAAREGDLAELRGIGRRHMPAERLASLERGLAHQGPLRREELDRLGDGLPAGSRAALHELAALEPLLEATGDAQRTRVDLGLLPTLPYYTGIVFQATDGSIPFPLGAGGRYDRLLPRYGVARPATGFAINVPHLHRAMVARGWRPADGRPLVVLTGGDDATLLGTGAALRARGLAVVLGDVAETAGRAVVRARVLGDGHVEVDGVRRRLDELTAIAGGVEP